MPAPALQAYIQGQGAASADNLNTFESTCDTIVQLRGFIGLPGMQVFVRGFLAIGDGGGGPFYWSPTATGPDNGTSIIVPTGSAIGAWVRLAYVNFLQFAYTLITPSVGFLITVANNIGSLILNPTGTLSSGTITFPSAPVDGQILRISSTQIISSLTLSPASGQAISNAVTTLAAGGAVAYQYAKSALTWFPTA